MSEGAGMRKYQPAWERLKAGGEVTLRVKPHLRRRVVKALWKEKHEDITYKLQLQAQERKRQRMIQEYNIETWLLKLRLVDQKSMSIDEL